MAFDKAKVMRAAEKHLAQGKIPAAIKEYQQIVQYEPDDYSALNMLGDLLARTNQEEEAIKCFTRAAEHYREEGFTLKAIAMFKKVDRLTPGGVEIAAKLAPLYETQGLIVDARAQYLLVADAYSRGGQPAKALEVLRRIADLDPNNTDIRLKLAEGYLHENFGRDAAEAFNHVGGQLYARRAFDQALKAYARALKIVPTDRTALSGLTSTHIALGSADEAAEILERAVAEQPDDVELLSLLAHAHIEAENPAGAERATAQLVEHEPSSYKRFIEVINLYLKTGEMEPAMGLINRIAEPMLSGNEEEALAGLLNEVLERNPEQISALRLLVRLHSWQHDDEKLRGALERLVEAAEAAELPDEERSALAKLVRIAPEESKYAERLQQLGGTVEDFEAEEPFPSAGAEEVPTFESFILMNEETSAAAPVEETVQFEWNAVEPPAADPAASFADLNEDGVDAGTKTTEPPPSAGYQEFDFSGAAAAPPPKKPSKSPEAPSATSGDQRDAMLKQELESVDFYLAQGYADIALDTLTMLERQFGAHPEIQSRRKQLGESAPAPEITTPPPAEAIGQPEIRPVEETPAFQPEPVPEPVPQAPAPQVSSPPAATLDPGLAAIFDEFRTAVEAEELPADGDYETHYNLGLAYKEMDLLDEAVEEFQTAASLTAPRDGTPRYLQCCNLLGHCFIQKGMARLAVMWFKRGLDAPGHTEDEYQALRYELGNAYEQMGDLDQAIDVFSEVYGVNVSYRGVADKLRDLQSQKATN